MDVLPAGQPTFLIPDNAGRRDAQLADPGALPYHGRVRAPLVGVGPPAFAGAGNAAVRTATLAGASLQRREYPKAAGQLFELEDFARSGFS